jgi:hypothetical protein
VVEVVNKARANSQSNLGKGSVQHFDPWTLVNSFPKMVKGSRFRPLGDRDSCGW